MTSVMSPSGWSAPTHHYPLAPGAIRSLAVPSTFIDGTHREMLAADLALTRRQSENAEAELTEAWTEMADTHGAQRAAYRTHVRVCVGAFRVARKRYRDAWKRTAEFYRSSGMGRAA